jgi:hypothetical protein
MSVQQLRKSYVTLQLPASPAVGVALATFIARNPMRILSAQITASDTGTGAGATTVIVKKNGVQIPTQTALSIAQGAATHATSGSFIGSPISYPGGEGFLPNDVLTVDLTAVPATTSPKSVSVILHIVQTDV